MRIAVEGCAHGELETIYSIIQAREKQDGKKVDLLLCCGDFQAVRNLKDLQCMAVPDKFKDMGTFYKYYSGEKIAPVLTIFIGGNHEASNYLQELPYGGWVAPNIYYLGYAGVINVAGIRIAGFSGIYKRYNYMKGHHEYPPYNGETIRSVYHIRNLEIFRLKQLSGKIDVFMSHDWPAGVTEYGNVEDLLRRKRHFRDDIQNNCLGSPPAMELLKHHYPSHWFAAHLHCKFTANVPNENKSDEVTKFLALDKCLQRRQFLEILEIEHNHKLPIEISYDLEWLTVLFLTNHLLSVKKAICYMPGPSVNQDRYNFTPSDQEKERISQRFDNNLTIPLNFKKTVEPYSPQIYYRKAYQPNLILNHYTTEFCDKLSIDDPFVLLKHVHNIRDENESIKNTSSALFSSNISSIQHSSYSDLSYTIGEEKPSQLGFVIDTKPSPVPILVKTPMKLPIVKNNSIDNPTSSTKYQSIVSESEKKQDLLDKKAAVKVINLSEKLSESVIKESFLGENSQKVTVTTPVKSPTIENDSTSCPDNLSHSTQSQTCSKRSPKRENDDATEQSPINEVTTLNCKKFKRRNQLIYADEESSN